MTRKSLHYFQTDCINSIIGSLKNKNSAPYANCVTGFGKSVVMADLTERALKKGKRILQLVPNHTLCEQNYKQTFSYVENKQAIGICSAKLSKYQTNKQAVIATQTSFLRRRTTSGAFDVVLVDECDMVSPDPDTTYQKIIKSLLRLNPAMRIVGMTGSPYREGQGEIHNKVKDGNVIFTECCYESDIPRLINEGYLSSVKILNSHVSVNLDGVRMKGNDYDQQACGLKFDKIIVDAVADFKQLFNENGINTALIFASTIANGQRIVNEYGNNNECKLAHGELSTHERNVLIHWLKEGNGKRYLVNVGLYTRGFDFPGLEALVLLRATTSLRLYIQIIGRLLRAHDEKECGFLADYGSNIERFGPIDNLTPPKPPRSGDCPKKLCLVPECGHINILSAKKCAKCGALFISENEDGLYSMKTKAEILAAKREAETVRHEVSSVEWIKCYSKKDGTPMIKGILCEISYDNIPVPFYEWYLCLNHTGGIKNKANHDLLRMFKNSRDYYKLGTVGVTVDNVLMLLNEHPGFFKTIKSVTLAPGTGKYKQLKEVEFDA